MIFLPLHTATPLAEPQHDAPAVTGFNTATSIIKIRNVRPWHGNGPTYVPSLRTDFNQLIMTLEMVSEQSGELLYNPLAPMVSER